MSAKCWEVRRKRKRLDIAIRRVTRDPWLVIALSDRVALVGIARWSLMESIRRAGR